MHPLSQTDANRIKLRLKMTTLSSEKLEAIVADKQNYELLVRKAAKFVLAYRASHPTADITESR